MLYPTIIRIIKQQERNYFRQLKSVTIFCQVVRYLTWHAYQSIGLAVKTSQPHISKISLKPYTNLTPNYADLIML